MASKAPSHRMQGLLGEFKKLYEGRLAKLKDKTQQHSTSSGDANISPAVKDSFTNYEVEILV